MSTRSPTKSHRRTNEQTPLLSDPERNGRDTEYDEIISFDKNDPENPREWTRRAKLTNVGIIALMAVLSPLASSMFTPGMNEIAKDLGASTDAIVGATTGFVVMLGMGPLILAPLSETFGRRNLYMICFGVFTVLQVPTALSPNLACLIACRTIAGLFGSVSIANGGGTINDMFLPSERAGVFGWYLLGPLLGPTIGPLLGGAIVEYMNWRWVFWSLTILCSINTLIGYFFLRETYAPIILRDRCRRLQQERGGRYSYEDEDTRPLTTKVLASLRRPMKILVTQPIVFIMAVYQAVIFAVMYTLFTNMQSIYGNEPYNFDTVEVGLLFLGPGLGFLFAVRFIVPKVDTVYNRLAKKNGGEGKPEYRLPLTNIGAVLLPLTLFWFGWTVEYKLHWAIPMAATPFFGLGQVAIFNTVQNYYIDAFSKYAASAIAAGAMFRSLVGGVIPLVAPEVFRQVGYGWGWSIFGFTTLLLAPSPLIFMRYGETLRERFAVEL